MAGTVDLVQRCHAGVGTRGGALRLEPRLPSAIGELRLGLYYRGHWGVDLTCRQDLVRVALRPGAASPIRVSYGAEDIEIQPGTSWEGPCWPAGRRRPAAEPDRSKGPAGTGRTASGEVTLAPPRPPR